MRWIFSLVLLLLFGGKLRAQYLVSGAAPSNLKWNQVKTPQGKVIAPDYYTYKAQMIAGYMDQLRGVITNGLADRVDRVPVVLYPTRVQSNGLVTWAPKRMELYTAPPPNTFAVPWLKQLVAHEYRHLVQMSNLNIGFTRVASYVLGEQMLGLVALLPSTWFFEGDATYAETALSLYGRGLQPEFTIEYRAMLNENKNYFNIDKWVCGSYKDNVPDRYKLGYQVVRASREYYGDDFWEKVLRYTGRNPYFIIPRVIASRKYAGVTTVGIFKRTFSDLKEFWEIPSSQTNSTSFIDTLPVASYTTYKFPLAYDSSYVIAYKKNMDHPGALVAFDCRTGTESLLCDNTSISSRAILADNNELYWTEYSPSLFWEQKSSSVVYKMSLEMKDGMPIASRRKKVLVHGNIFYVTPIDEGFAMVSYDRLNRPSVLYTDDSFSPIDNLPFEGEGVSINGMAWDASTQTLAAIVLDDSGMRMVSIDRQKRTIRNITKPSSVTIDHLSAIGGRLYFNSIASGKDEAHLYDLRSDIEYRATTSKYGTVMPAPINDTLLLATTYAIDGYLLSKQSYRIDTLEQVVWSKLPQNTLNKPIKKWDLNIDTLSFASSASQAKRYPVKKYSKAAHSYRPHSWIPIAIDIDKLVDEYKFDVGIGVTAISQNTLGTMVSNLQYGWMPSSGKDFFKASLSYSGLPVHVSVDLEYGGQNQQVYIDYINDEIEPSIFLKNHFKVSPMLSMPMDFSDGGNRRVLTPYSSFSYYNSLRYNVQRNDYVKGSYKLVGGVQFVNYKYSTPKALSPRLGYVLSLSYGINPIQKENGKLFSAYAKGYLPGIFPLHTLQLEAAVQHQRIGRYNYLQKTLYPMGCDYSYASHNLSACAATYGLPLAYPDGGISDFIYFKRISLFAFGQYAYNQIALRKGVYKELNPYTYGGEVRFDFNILRILVDIQLGVSVYKPSDKDRPMVGASLNLNF